MVDSVIEENSFVKVRLTVDIEFYSRLPSCQIIAPAGTVLISPPLA